MMGNWDQQICKRCHKKQRFEFHIKDDIWHLIPDHWWNKVLCIECFLELLDQAVVVPCRFALEDFVFLGFVGDRIHAILYEAK